MCSYESYDVCRFYGQIYIKIPNYKPVEIKNYCHLPNWAVLRRIMLMTGPKKYRGGQFVVPKTRTIVVS